MMNQQGLIFTKFVVFVSLITQIASQVTIAKNTQVTPRCGSQLISIEINFDPNQLPDGRFNDWIVVGVSGRPECRLHGNGETKYIIEIAVFNDPCLTQIPARNVFQNRIRIGKNPVVILEGDQSITVKCVYGLPTVETLAMPVINPNFNIDNFGQPSIPTNNDAESGFTSFSNNENIQNVNSDGKNTFSGSVGTSNRQVGLPTSNTQDSQNNNFDKESNRGMNLQTNDANRLTTPSFDLNTNPIRPQIPFRNGNNDLQLITSFPSVSNVPQQPQQGNEEFGLNGLNATAPTRRTSFSILFILAIIFLIIFILLLLACLYFFLRKKREERSKRLLMDGVSSADEGKRTGSRAWWTDGSTDGYISPGTVQNESVASGLRTNPKPSRSATATIFDKRNQKATVESREVPIPTVSVRKNFSDTTSHYSRAGQATNNNRLNQSTSARKSSSKKSPAPQPPRSNAPPLRSNLEEFVSKTYAMGEYNSLTSPAYGYTSEVYDEREVDIGFDTSKSTKIKRRPRTDDKTTHSADDNAVSSYRSITEIVHAAETANISRETAKPNEQKSEMEKILTDCVTPIRGFGYRKLTEQEMGRWKNLIQRDSYLRNLLISSKSVAEIEDIFESDDYKNMFSSTKWHEIAQCVHRALTNSLDRTNSQSQLQLFVGNVQSDW